MLAGTFRVVAQLPHARACLALAACVSVAACGTSSSIIDLAANTPPAAAAKEAKDAPKDTRDELVKATEYWGKEFAKNPRDPEKALNYARNLKAMGEKRQALVVLQQASVFTANNRAINSEYGRLALEFDQVSVAQRLLEQADDPTNPDWRVISARGTVQAKQGNYRNAIPFYERALALAPNQPSVLSNLALAYTMEGNAAKAEPLLKRAADAGGEDPRVSQNLALVLGLQGKYDEAKLAASRDLPADKAAADVEFIRSIVLAEAQPLAPTANSKVETSSTKRASPKAAAKAKDGAPGWAPQVAASPAKE